MLQNQASHMQDNAECLLENQNLMPQNPTPRNSREMYVCSRLRKANFPSPFFITFFFGKFTRFDLFRQENIGKKNLSFWAVKLIIDIFKDYPPPPTSCLFFKYLPPLRVRNFVIIFKALFMFKLKKLLKASNLN